MIKLFEEGGDDPEKMRVRAYMEVQYRDLDKDGDGKIQLVSRSCPTRPSCC